MAAVILLSAAGVRAQDTPASEVSASYSAFWRQSRSESERRQRFCRDPAFGDTVSMVRGSFGIVFRFGNR